MNAEATAENRPACDQVSVCTANHFRYKTHEDESRVQILVVFLYKLLVIIFCLLAVVLKEPRPLILLSDGTFCPPLCGS